MAANTMTVDRFAGIYSQGYVYRSGTGVNLGNTVVERNFTTTVRGQTTTVTQTGLGIDCSGLATRYLWENDYNIPYKSTGLLMPSADTLAKGADKYFDKVGAADVRTGDLVYFTVLRLSAAQLLGNDHDVDTATNAQMLRITSFEETSDDTVTLGTDWQMTLAANCGAWKDAA